VNCPAYENPARKLMLMVGELHRMGYQKIRFYPHIGGAGYWRYILTVVKDRRVEPEWDPSPEEKRTVWNSLGDGELRASLYGWGDQVEDTPERLARRFLAAFKTIKRLGKGKDQKYANWYRNVLEKIAPEGIIYCWWDGSSSCEEGIGVLNKDGVVSLPLPPGERKYPLLRIILD
jgi:hypothetical protein